MTNRLEAEFYGRAAETIGRLPTVTVEGALHIREAQTWLQNGGSIVLFFFPHTCIDDPIVLNERLVRPEILPYVTGKYGMPTSVKMMDLIPEVTGLEKERKAAYRYAQLAGFDMIPVFQQYLLRGLIKEHPHLEGVASHMNESALRNMVRVLREQGGLIGISPEGSRKQEGKVYRANPHMSVLLKNKKAPVAALPVALNGMHQMQPLGKEGFHGLNPFVDVSIHVGSLIPGEAAIALSQKYAWKNPEALAVEYKWEQDETRDFTPADALMLQAIRELPLEAYIPDVDPRGIYAEENIVLK